MSPKSYSAGAAEVNKKGSLTFLGVFEKSPLTKSGEFEYSAGSEPLYPLERATLSAW